jgi:hypothetical protein
MRRGDHSFQPAYRRAPQAAPVLVQRPAYMSGAPDVRANRAEVARLFQMLRRHLSLTPEHAAAIFKTRWDVIAALEAGRLEQLPAWPETQRIVLEYTNLCRLDPRPVLHLMQQAMHPPLKRIAREEDEEERPSVLSRLTSSASGFFKALRFASGFSLPSPRMLFAVILPAAALFLFTQSAVLEAAANKLPSPMAKMFQGAREYVLAQMAPVREGLRWIEVDNPRERRGDKLRDKQR